MYDILITSNANTKDEAGNVAQTSDWNIENKTVTEPAVPTKTGYTGSWEQYNFDTLQNLNVGVQYSIGLTINYLDENGTYKAEMMLHMLHTHMLQLQKQQKQRKHLFQVMR